MTFRTILQLLGWEIINPLILRIKKNKKYLWDERYDGLNLGCGIDNIPSWIGIDGGFTHFFIYKFPKFLTKFYFNKLGMSRHYSFDEYLNKLKSFKLIHFDIRYTLPFYPNTIPNLYSSHFLEHFSEQEGEIVLKEVYSKLKPGGKMRIAVPSIDLEINKILTAIKDYKSGNISTIQKYVTNMQPSYGCGFDIHRYMYNITKLKEKIKEAGFISIIESSYRSEIDCKLGFLDTRPDSIFVEAEKPVTILKTN